MYSSCWYALLKPPYMRTVPCLVGFLHDNILCMQKCHSLLLQCWYQSKKKNSNQMNQFCNPVCAKVMCEIAQLILGILLCESKCVVMSPAHQISPGCGFGCSGQMWNRCQWDPCSKTARWQFAEKQLDDLYDVLKRLSVSVIKCSLIVALDLTSIWHSCLSKWGLWMQFHTRGN